MRIRLPCPCHIRLRRYVMFFFVVLCPTAEATSHLTNAVSLTICGGWSSPGRAVRQLRVVPPHAYLLLGDKTLQILDIGDPSNPVELSQYETAGTPQDVQIVGNYAFLAETWRSQSNGVEIVDVSSATSPVQIATTVISGLPNRLTVAEGYVYLAETIASEGVAGGLGAVEILAVTNPANPVIVTRFNTDAPVRDIKLAGDYAYFTGGSNALNILDIHNPTNLQRLATFPTNGAPDKSYSGYALEFDNGYVYLSTWVGFFIVDVHDPLHPALASDILPAGNFEGADIFYALSLAGHFAGLTPLVRDGWGYIIYMSTVFYDMSNPANWIRLGSYQFPGAVVDIQVTDEQAYVATETELIIYDMAVLPYFTSVTLINQKLLLTWNGEPGLSLQHSVQLNEPQWVDVPDSDGQSRFEWPLNSNHEFFRLLRR